MMDASCKQSNYIMKNILTNVTGFFHRRKKLNEFCSYCDQLYQVEEMGVLCFIKKKKDTHTYSLPKWRPRECPRKIMKQGDVERELQMFISRQTWSFTQLTHVELQLRSVSCTDGDKPKWHHAYISDRSTSVLIRSLLFLFQPFQGQLASANMDIADVCSSLPWLLLCLYRLPMQHL